MKKNEFTKYTNYGINAKNYIIDIVSENIWQYKNDINLSRYSQIRSHLIIVFKMKVHIQFSTGAQKNK